MNRIKEAQVILKNIGLPPAQCNKISAITFLALADIGKSSSWSGAKRVSLRIHDILLFTESKYGKNMQKTQGRQSGVKLSTSSSRRDLWFGTLMTLTYRQIALVPTTL